MKKTNKISKWCKRTLMLLPVVAILTFMSCQKYDMLPEAVNASQSETGALLHATSLARASVAGTYVIDFESVATSLLAGPTSYGENLYDGYQNQYTGYTDAATGLWIGINPTGKWSSDPNFYNGGIAISRWNNMVMPGDSNQCSVYYDNGSGKGGYNGSETFAVHYGYYDTIAPPAFSMGDTRSYIKFEDTDQTATFNGFYVNNSTYAYLAMRDGYYVASPLEPDNGWFKLVVEGIKPDGSSSGKVVEYLADFQSTAVLPGILDYWKWVDLTPLGNEVNAIRFDVAGSDSGDYGLNTPAYFCFDDLSVTISD